MWSILQVEELELFNGNFPKSLFMVLFDFMLYA